MSYGGSYFHSSGLEVFMGLGPGPHRCWESHWPSAGAANIGSHPLEAKKNKIKWPEKPMLTNKNNDRVICNEFT